jgi:AraC-like DNA-binding protein
MNSTFYSFFNAFTLINLSVLFIILFFRKNNSITNKLLALIVVNPGLNFISNILIQSGYIFKAPYAVFLFFGTAQLYAPLVLAYALAMMGQKFRFVSILSLLTSIIIILDGYFAIRFSMLNSVQQYEYLKNLTSANHYPEDLEIINMLFVIAMTLYFAVALVKIRKNKKVAKDYYSDIEKTKIQYIWYFVLLVTILNTALAAVYGLFPAPVVEYFYIPLITNIINVYIVYYAFNHSAILDKTEFCNLVNEATNLERYKEMNEPLCKEVKELKKQENSNKKWKLTEIEIETNYKNILKYVETKKPYLDPNLNLTKFSSDLNACSHNISLTINFRVKQNFFDFINSYRIEEAKRLLNELKENNYTIESVGFDSGFNSKASFYRAFKKHTQLTPSEYVKLQQNN